MKNSAFTFLVMLLLALSAASCQLPSILPTPTATATPTLEPTNTPLPTKTPSCDPLESLERARKNIPYEQASANHKIIQGQRHLSIWYVNPTLGPNNSLEDNQNRAILDSVALLLDLANNDPCFRDAFYFANPIVVDSQYNGWFSGQIEVDALPAVSSPSEDDLAAIADQFTVGYLADAIPASPEPAPAGSCTWVEAESKIRLHFSSTRPQVTFYFVIDRAGTNVWAQWDGPTDGAIVIANLYNINMELQCLHPRPTQLIAMIVDDEGNLRHVGFLAINPDDYMDLSGYEYYNLE